VHSLEEGRELVRRSSQVREHQPADRGPWDQAYARFIALRAHALRAG
jgi:hypothetical protein